MYIYLFILDYLTALPLYTIYLPFTYVSNPMFCFPTMFKVSNING